MQVLNTVISSLPVDVRRRSSAKIFIFAVVFYSSGVAQVPPKIQPFAFPAFVEEGKHIQVTCGLETHDTAEYFKWFKDGHPLHSGTKWTILSPGRVSVLIINSATTETSGNYTCAVRNSVGQDEFTTELRVKGPPKWKQQPKDMESSIGETVRFHCSAWGYPIPSIIWKRQKGEKYVDVSKTSESNGTLTIQDIRKHNAGFYICEANNGIGDSLSKQVELYIRV
ncbi:Down syndrome cell adhesion molecule-like protein Dscam2 isoform X2 [Limulus polyphemus]|uniref:Down syndrome cell adhesion molecule-like protein Dscam2 isoform X2 n=1 Tax=Limulus polyphemus TaxID=6850 RepID=A0ABM1RXT8_LIMPO|nr:Down syndrome cell adhesion molecule-like protein Dscam2 isoform X2 [Limulus polyphemus]